MAKQTDSAGFWRNVLATSLYKRNQGRLTRQLTAVGIVLIIWFGAWTLSQGPLSDAGPWQRVGVPLALSVLGVWLAIRVINWPRFADFLISVEAEMDKVTWASRQDLHRATVVVISAMAFIGAVLLLYDVVWVWLFTLVRILKPVGS